MAEDAGGLGALANLLDVSLYVLKQWAKGNQQAQPQKIRSARKVEKAQEANENPKVKKPSKTWAKNRERDSEILATYNSKERPTLCEIGERFGLTRSRILQIVQCYGAQRKSGDSVSYSEILAAYDSEEQPTCDELGERFGLTSGRIARIVRCYGTPRKRGKRKGHCGQKRNENYERDNEILTAYHSGLTYRELAEMHGMQLRKIGHIVHEATNRKRVQEKNEYEKRFGHLVSFDLDTPVGVLGISNMAVNCLLRGRITTVRELATTSTAELKNIRNLGKKTLAEIMRLISILKLKPTAERKALDFGDYQDQTERVE
jgi:hypothetical protein